MAYRGAIETALARCAFLQERVRILEQTLRLPWTAPLVIEAETHDEACEMERRLAARLADLEEEMAQRLAEESGVEQGTAVPQTEQPVRFPSHLVLGFVITIILTLLIIVIQFGERPTEMLYRAAGHTRTWNEHCSIQVDRKGDACDVTVQCVTMTRRGHTDRCTDSKNKLVPHIDGFVDVDEQHSVVHVTDEQGVTFDVELDPWHR